MNFEIPSQAYQAFSELKQLQIKGELKGEQMAVITHNSDSQPFKIDDFIDFTGNDHTSNDSLIGMLIGILGGILGVMLGWFTGSMIGARRDAKEIEGAQSVFEQVINQIGEGETGLVLIADETDNRPINNLIMMQLGGQVTRLDYETVAEEIQHAKELEKTTRKAVKKDWEAKHPKVKPENNQTDETK